MPKNLPHVYQNPINKVLNNNRKVFYSSNTPKVSPNPTNISKKINTIFSSPTHVYKSKVLITTSNGDITTEIVGKTSTNLLALDGTRISIDDIQDITKI